MDDEQYDIMAQAEERHWWYLGLRDAMAQCLRQHRFSLPAHPRVLDAGCGTGANLRFLAEHFNPSELVGFDVSPKAIEFAKRKVPNAELYVSDLRDPVLRCHDFDLIISCDVLYVTGVTEALQGLIRLTDALKPGGTFVWNLPAYNWMTSYHDRVVHTRERFTRSTLESLNHRLGLRCFLISYRLCALFPILVAKRLSAYLPFANDIRSDLRLPSPFVNRCLFGLLQCENRFIARGISFPWGSSIFAVYVKS